VPALVPLVADESWVGSCAGVSLSSARVWIDLAGQQRGKHVGDVLFTHTGLSGRAALDLSGDVAGLLERSADTAPAAVPLRLEPIAGTSASAWRERVGRWRDEHPKRMVRTLLDQHLPHSLAEAACRLAGIARDTRACEMTRTRVHALVSLMGGVPLSVVATQGFDRAMITRGGVCLKEIDPQSLESRCLAGLFLAGEMVDLDGPCGGYNLQWAFSSGYLAGRSAARGALHQRSER